MPLSVLILCISCVFSSTIATAETDNAATSACTVIRPSVEHPGNVNCLHVVTATANDGYFSKQEQYFLALIDLALEKSRVPHQVHTITLAPHTETRSLNNLLKGTYDIYWLNTTSKLEQQLQPIRIPLFKGLIGWKLLLIRKDDEALFTNIDTLSQLQPYRVLHGYDWADTPLLISNGFKVITSTEFRNISRMLARRRGDIFPRSVIEIWGQLEAVKGLNLAVEKNLVLQFPAAYYFFVHPDNVRLHQAIEAGLEKSLQDGSFTRLFMSFYGQEIKAAELHTRKPILLDNPTLPSATPLHRKELWFGSSK